MARVVLGAALRGEHRVLGSDARVVEPGADRRGFEDLAVLVLQEQRTHAVHHAGDAPFDRGAVMSGLEPEPAGFDADQPRVGVEEARERSDRVRPAADARDDDVGIGAVEDLAALPARFVADDALELAHHPRERVRTHRRTEAVVRRLDARDPRRASLRSPRP